MAGAELPDLIRPMLAKPGQPFDSAEHIFEIKWDGLRTMAYVDSAGLRLMSRGGFDTTARFPDLDFLRDLRPGSVLDGEIIVLVDGKPSFAKALSRSRENVLTRNKAKAAVDSAPAIYVVFDQLYHDFTSLLKRPLSERRSRLAETVTSIDRSALAFSDGIEGAGLTFYDSVVAQGLEGVVAKRIESAYAPGRRSDDWLKIKPRQEMLCVVIGYLQSGKDLRSLILAADFEGELRFVGKVGSGIDREERDNLLALLKASERNSPVVSCDERGIWVEPSIFVQVSYHELTERGELRAPVFERRVEGS